MFSLSSSVFVVRFNLPNSSTTDEKVTSSTGNISITISGITNLDKGVSNGLPNEQEDTTLTEKSLSNIPANFLLTPSRSPGSYSMTQGTLSPSRSIQLNLNNSMTPSGNNSTLNVMTFTPTHIPNNTNTIRSASIGRSEAYENKKINNQRFFLLFKLWNNL